MMGLLRNIKILLTGNIDERVEYASVDPWNLEAENPAPRAVEVEAPPIPVKVAAPVFVDPWGSVKKPRGAMNLLKLAVTLFMLVDVCAALFFISSSMVITGAALAVFIPNAAFLFMLRGKL